MLEARRKDVANEMRSVGNAAYCCGWQGLGPEWLHRYIRNQWGDDHGHGEMVWPTAEGPKRSCEQRPGSLRSGIAQGKESGTTSCGPGRRCSQHDCLHQEHLTRQGDEPPCTQTLVEPKRLSIRTTYTVGAANC